MASPSLKPAILLAAWCAASSGCASSRAPGVPQDYPDVVSYRAARERLVQQEQAQRLSAALVLSAEKARARAVWEERWAGFVRWLSEGRPGEEG
jgi:hypothetical protein